MAKVLHLFRAPRRHAPMEELSTACAIEDSGLEGCAHARPGGKRQVLLVDVEILRSLNLTPGITRENITTEGLDVNALQVGQDATGWQCAPSGQHRLRAMWSVGDHPPRFAAATGRPSWNALQGVARRHLAAWGYHRSASVSGRAPLPHEFLGNRFALQRRCFRRPVLILCLLLDRFFRRHDPLEPAALTQRSLEKVCFARQQRQ